MAAVRRSAVCFVLCTCFAVASATASIATPLGKVVELLDDLKTQIDEEGKKEAILFDKFTKWSHDEIREATLTIEETESEIQQLKASLEEQEAFREGKKQELEAQVAELASNEAELKQATEVREHEHRVYSKDEEAYVSSIDALERSIEVLQKQDGGGGGASALQAGAAQPSAAAAALQVPSLVAVASSLRKTLEHSKDIRLTTGQQETLDELFRAAVDAQPSDVAPSFLQAARRVARRDPYSDYESSSGGVTSTLQGVLDKAKADREASMKKEQNDKNAFELVALALKNQIDSGNENLEEIKVAIAHSQEESAQKQADLNSAKDLLKTTKDHKSEVNAQLNAKTSNYHKREQKRSDELIALQEAVKILTSDAAKRFKKQQTVGDLEDDDASPSFLQLHSKQQRQMRRRTIDILEASSSPGLVFLALKMQTRVRAGADPFVKAKDMIRSLLEKLLQEQNEEAEHHAWCQEEMAKSAKSKHDKEKQVNKLEDRIDAMDAEIQTLSDDLNTLNTDLADMAQALAQATEVRNEERDQATVSMKDYHDGHALVMNAITVLKNFYHKAAEEAAASGAALIEEDDEPEVPSGDYQVKDQSAAGIIGILEIAAEDFAQQEEETKMNEAAAQKDFDDLMAESAVKRAVFQKDVEYKSRAKVKYEGDRSRTAADLRSYKKELGAVNEYIAKLTPTCTVKGDTYEERKRRREAELQSLQQALEVLNGQGIP